jgi:hypothetical protein
VAASASGSDLRAPAGNECDTALNTCPAGNQIGNSLSIVHLSSSLGLLQSWLAPGTAGNGHDWDFGASPTLFGTGGMPPDVGACNKNGKFYALAASPLGSSPLWTDMIGAPAGTLSSCLASAVWDGPAGALYVGGDGATIGGTSFGGSVRQVNPDTGTFIWQTSPGGDHHRAAAGNRRQRGTTPRPAARWRAGLRRVLRPHANGNGIKEGAHSAANCARSCSR